MSDAINQNWPRWIFASISQHFEDGKGDYPLYIEGQERDTKGEDIHLELRVDGPYVYHHSKGDFTLYFEVNVLIQAKKTGINYHTLYDVIGQVVALFVNIKVYKYGDAVGDDDSLLGCMKLISNREDRERIMVSHFGQLDPHVDVIQAGVEGHYDFSLQGA